MTQPGDSPLDSASVETGEDCSVGVGANHLLGGEERRQGGSA